MSKYLTKSILHYMHANKYDTPKSKKELHVLILINLHLR